MKPILARVSQGSVLGLVLNLLYMADMSTTRLPTTVTSADNRAILSSQSNYERASHNLQKLMKRYSQNGLSTGE